MDHKTYLDHVVHFISYLVGAADASQNQGLLKAVDKFVNATKEYSESLVASEVAKSKLMVIHYKYKDGRMSTSTSSRENLVATLNGMFQCDYLTVVEITVSDEEATPSDDD